MGAMKNRKRFRSDSGKNLCKSFALGDPRGFPGVLLMCDESREKRASFEFSDWLNEIIDDLAESNVSNDPDTSDGSPCKKKSEFRSIEDEIKEELSNLTGSAPASGDVDILGSEKKKLEKKFLSKKTKFVEIGVRGMGLLWINDVNIDITSILHDIFENAKNTHQFRTRCSSRIIPLQSICSPTLSSIEETLSKLVADVDKDLGYSFKVEFRIRNSTQISKMEIFNLVHNVLGPKAKVSLSNPDKIILIEGVKSFVGVSVLPGWAWEKYHRYNIRNTAETDEQKKFRLEKAAEQVAKKAGERLEEVEVDHDDIAFFLGENTQVWVAPSKQ